MNGLRVSACLHVTSAETANLTDRSSRQCGADVVLCSLQSALHSGRKGRFLAQPRFQLFLPTISKGEDQRNLLFAFARRARTTTSRQMDHGRCADLVTMLLTKRTDLVQQCHRRTEETTPVVIRLRACPKRHDEVSDHRRQRRDNTKHFFDNRSGTGKSTRDGVHPRN